MSFNARFSVLDILKHFFDNFLSRRGLEQHYRRGGILVAGKPEAQRAGAALPSGLPLASDAAVEDLYQRFQTRADGLSDQEATDKLKAVGANEVHHERPMAWLMHLWICYRNPFSLLLSTLAVISWLTGDAKAAVVIGVMVVLATVLRFVQEGRSNRAAERLKAMVSNTATVLRHDPVEELAEQWRGYGVQLHPKGPRKLEIPIRCVVPGDIVQLSAGDMIPADLRILSAKDLFVSEAAMTGESLPVEKFTTQYQAVPHGSLKFDNLAFMGTNVVSGTATGLVIATGDRTYFGALAHRVTASDRTPTAFQAGVNQVSWLLIRFMLVMTPIVLLLNGLTKGDWLEASLFALSVAVGLTPEMLPMIVTTTLARGAVVLSRQKVIVKRLESIQNFGAMDVLCTDKTGTLTQDKIVLGRHSDVDGKTSEEVLRYAYLNSYHQTGLKNLLDVAVLEHAEVHAELMADQPWRKVDEIPFDFQRRRMSVVVQKHESEHLLICKGALEEVLTVCTALRRNGVDEPMSNAAYLQTLERAGDLNSEGLRVIAVATRTLPVTDHAYTKNDEKRLTLIGTMAFLDPPKETAAVAIKALMAHGVAVKVLTGDNELVTQKICRDVGLNIEGRVLLGEDVERLDDRGLANCVETHSVFAKLTPLQKERLVRALRSKGHVVGFLGDGINDAPALRAADIGISVDSAVDIAKEAADLILLEKSLLVLEQGVIQGRRTFANMLKYIRMTASSNFGNVFSVLVAGVFLPFLPMLPVHLLVQNLFYDFSQIAIPFDNVDEEEVRHPQRWNPGGIGRFMLFFGPISSIFDITTYAMMWFVFSANTPARQTLFQSGWFIEGLLSQTLIVHLIRTRKIPFLQSVPASPLAIASALIVTLGVFLPMGPMATYLQMQALPWDYFPLLAFILLGYAGLVQAMKSFYTHRFGWQ